MLDEFILQYILLKCNQLQFANKGYKVAAYRHLTAFSKNCVVFCMRKKYQIWYETH